MSMSNWVEIDECKVGRKLLCCAVLIFSPTIKLNTDHKKYKSYHKVSIDICENGSEIKKNPFWKCYMFRCTTTYHTSLKAWCLMWNVKENNALNNMWTFSFIFFYFHFSNIICCFCYCCYDFVFEHGFPFSIPVSTLQTAVCSCFSFFWFHFDCFDPNINYILLLKW